MRLSHYAVDIFSRIQRLEGSLVSRAYSTSRRGPEKPWVCCDCQARRSRPSSIARSAQQSQWARQLSYSVARRADQPRPPNDPLSAREEVEKKLDDEKQTISDDTVLVPPAPQADLDREQHTAPTIPKTETEATVEASSTTASQEALPSHCLLYTSPSPRDGLLSRMPSSA